MEKGTINHVGHMGDVKFVLKRFVTLSMYNLLTDDIDTRGWGQMSGGEVTRAYLFHQQSNG